MSIKKVLRTDFSFLPATMPTEARLKKKVRKKKPTDADTEGMQSTGRIVTDTTKAFPKFVFNRDKKSLKERKKENEQSVELEL